MRAAWAITAFVVLGCDTAVPPPDADGGVIPDGGGSTFDDHTRPSLATVADFDALRAPGPGLASVKVLITDFSTPAARAVRYYDGHFYTLHDEWYWFRLLNGQPVAGDPEVMPVRGFRFESIAIIYAWAQQRATLPLDLVFGQGRLYSSRFYQRALELEPRAYGLATLLRVPAKDGRPERWVFELEYSDDTSHADLVTFFQSIEASLPASVASQLLWVVRSPEQEVLALDMEARQLAYHDRIVRYRDITTPGEKEVYAEGITAGRVRVVRAGDSLEGGASTDVLVLEASPDYLPPATALITSVPQTPLAHVNVLARNRGIPNAYLGAAVDDPQLDQLGRVNAPALIYAAAPSTLEVVALTNEQYSAYLSKLQRIPSAVSPVDLTGVQYVYDLTRLSPSDSDRWRPIIGGKSTGFLEVLATPGVTHPDKVLGLSIKAYVEHLAPLKPQIEQLIRHPTFSNDARVRFAVLEGEGDYRQRYTRAADVTFLTQLLDQFRGGTLIGDIIRAGGVRGLLRAAPIEPATLAAITESITTTFGDYADTQGLRFRSSSNVEDIEGFNGAGLYDSNTGFINPLVQPDPGDHKQSIEWAIKKTWASYWGFEAFEERRLELVDHLSGSMGVTVHARFDDDKETSNGVITFTILPPAPVEGPLAGRVEQLVMEVNAQLGAESVTNPNPSMPSLPEVDRVILDRNAATTRIARVRPSTLAMQGQLVLSDAELRALFDQTRAITERWLTRLRAASSPAQAPRTLTLDFEYRGVAAGWPALRSGVQEPARVVVKQARTLEPSLPRVDPVVRTVPLPRDVLSRARRVTRTTCSDDTLSIVVWDARTDPLTAPDLGYGELPFVASVSVLPRVALPDLGLTAGSTVTLTHLEFEARHSPDLVVTASVGAALDRVEVGPGNRYRVVRGGREVTGEAFACRPVVLYANAKELLFQYLEEAGR